MIYYTDGFRNKKASGFTVTDEAGKILRHNTNPPQSFTNNEAELQGIIAAVVMIQEGGEVITDSQVCVHWIRNGRAAARLDLNHLIGSLKAVIRDKKIRVVWQPRENNKAGKVNERL